MGVGKEVISKIPTKKIYIKEYDDYRISDKIDYGIISIIMIED